LAEKAQLLAEQQDADNQAKDDANPDQNDNKSAPFDKDLSQSAISHDDQDNQLMDEKDLDIEVKEKMHPELEAIQNQIDDLTKAHEDELEERRVELMTKADINFTMEELESRSRWIIPANKSIFIAIKFFSKEVGQFEAITEFDTTFSIGKPFPYKLNANCSFPEISNFYKNIYMNVRRARSQNMPESLISRAYVTSESVFDFGPL